jgi:hypothetical protein
MEFDTWTLNSSAKYKAHSLPVSVKLSSSSMSIVITAALITSSQTAMLNGFIWITNQMSLSECIKNLCVTILSSNGYSSKFSYEITISSPSYVQTLVSSTNSHLKF